MDQKILAAAMVLAASVIIAPAFSQAELFPVPTNFVDMYEGNQTWTDFGSLSGVTDNNGVLEVSNPPGTGTFVGTTIPSPETISFEAVTVDANPDNQADSEITVYAYDEFGGQIASETFILQEGSEAYTLNLLNNTSQQAYGYSFDITLRDSGTVDTVVVEGKRDSAENLTSVFGTIIFFVLTSLGILFLLSSLGGRRR